MYRYSNRQLPIFDHKMPYASVMQVYDLDRILCYAILVHMRIF